MKVHLAPSDPAKPAGAMTMKAGGVDLGSVAAVGKASSGGIKLGSGSSQLGNSGPSCSVT